MREVDMLKRRDAGVGKISFVDIAAEDYSPKDNAGIDFEEVHSLLTPEIYCKHCTRA